MNIIIAGAGAVGTHLAKLLSREKHNIVVVDENADRIERIDNQLDVQGFVGQPMSIATLKEIDVAHADLFVSVTPDEAHNLATCMLANKLGAKKTIARVDNAEFVTSETQEFFKSVGIHSTFYPEQMAATEIMAGMKRSWIRQFYEFNDGKLVLLGVKVRQGAPLLEGNRPIYEIAPQDAPYHIVAIKRCGSTIIPRGNHTLQDRDLVYFMTTPEHLSAIRELVGKEEYKEVQSLFVVGADDTTRQLIRMIPKGMHVKVFEESSIKRKVLLREVNNNQVTIFRSDGHDIDLLREEGLDHAQAFAALSGNSEENILSCLVAKQAGVRKTVAMIDNLDYLPLAENLDIGTVVNKPIFVAGKIYEMMLKADVASVKSLTVAQADVAEFHVAENAPITKKMVRDLKLPEDVALGGLVRNGEGMLINGNTQIQAKDTVVVFCLINTVNKLEKFFNAEKSFSLF